jgi:hypothetical protein
MNKITATLLLWIIVPLAIISLINPEVGLFLAIVIACILWTIGLIILLEEL